LLRPPDSTDMPRNPATIESPQCKAIIPSVTQPRNFTIYTNCLIGMQISPPPPPFILVTSMCFFFSSQSTRPPEGKQVHLFGVCSFDNPNPLRFTSRRRRKEQNTIGPLSSHPRLLQHIPIFFFRSRYSHRLGRRRPASTDVGARTRLSWLNLPLDFLFLAARFRHDHP